MGRMRHSAGMMLAPLLAGPACVIFGPCVAGQAMRDRKTQGHAAFARLGVQKSLQRLAQTRFVTRGQKGQRLAEISGVFLAHDFQRIHSVQMAQSLDEAQTRERSEQTGKVGIGLTQLFQCPLTKVYILFVDGMVGQRKQNQQFRQRRRRFDSGKRVTHAAPRFELRGSVRATAQKKTKNSLSLSLSLSLMAYFTPVSAVSDLLSPVSMAVTKINDMSDI